MAGFIKRLVGSPALVSETPPHGRRAAVGTIKLSNGPTVKYVREDIMQHALRPKAKQAS